MKKIFLPILILILIFSVGCGNNAKKINSVEDLKNAKIGCWPGCGYEVVARKIFPDAQYIYFDFLSDLVQNLKQNKIDAFVLGKIYADELKLQGIEIDYLPENLGDVPTSYIFSKNERGKKICGEMNEFIKKISDNGELENLKTKWFAKPEDERIFQKSKLSGENGILEISTDAQSQPFVYIKNNNFTGFEVEILDKFCAAYGYDYEIKLEVFETMLTDVSLGKTDVGVDAIEKLPERENSVIFSIPTVTNQTVAIINSENVGENNFFDRIKISLLDENRWQMILEGTLRTISITIFSIIFGTLLGFAIYMLYREKNKILNKIINFFVRTIQGIPTMVLLLFFYYTIFGNVEIPASFVAVTVFSIILSVSVFIMLQSGEKSIPRGQMEAALSLGFSERRAFIKFIFPQIVRIFFPSYQLSINVILLETAIVGYIAVQDLTKMADLIRARTYDAFVPIIAIAIIYYILSKILMKITDKIAEKLEPKNRKPEKILQKINL